MPTTTPAQRVAREVKAHMAREGHSQAGLANALGLSQAAASRRLTGLVPFDVTELTAVSRWLGVPLSRLIGEDVA